MRPTRQFIALAVLVALVCVAYPGKVPYGIWFGVVVINAVLAALAISDLVRAPRRDDFRLTREHPGIVTMGTPFALTWRVENLTDLRLHIRVGDELAESLGAATRRFEITVPPMADGTATTEACPRRRGRFTPRRVVAEVRGPMGLAWRSYRLDTPSELHVHPVFWSRKVSDAKLRHGRTIETGVRRTKGVGTGTDFLQLRDYTPDDQFNRIDWAATGRRGRLVVRTYQPEQNQNVVVVLDSGRLMAANVADAPRFEHAVDAARALATLTTALGDKIGLITFDDGVHTVLRPERSRSQPTRLVDALFDIHPQLVESDYLEAFSEVVALVRRRSLLVLLTELSPAADTTGLFDAIPILTRRHRVLIACIKDPDLTQWAGDRPADVGEAFRSAAAADALRARRDRLARARRLGAGVVDTEPHRLAGELADAYLSIKSQGGL